MQDVKWANKNAVPAIGSQVKVCMNGLGTAQVVGYFTENGGDAHYLGLAVKFDDPPEWYVRQNGGNVVGHVFGTEVDLD